MILGRSTVQWTALITAAGGLVQILATLLTTLDPAVLAVVIGAIITFLGVFIAFLANTATTPIDDPRLKAGVVVSVLDTLGKLTGDKVRIEETPPGPAGIDATPNG